MFHLLIGRTILNILYVHIKLIYSLISPECFEQVHFHRCLLGTVHRWWRATVKEIFRALREAGGVGDAADTSLRE